MTQGITKERLLMKLNGEHSYLISILQSIPEARRESPGTIGDGSVKDLLAHLMGREQFLFVYLDLLKTGQNYEVSETQAEMHSFEQTHGIPDYGSPLAGDDLADDLLVAKFQDTPWQALTSQEDRVFEQLVTQVESLTRAELETDGVDRVIAVNTWEHYNQHLAKLLDLQV